MDNCAAKVDGVVGERAFDDSVSALEREICKAKQDAGFLDESRAHLDGGGSRLRVHAATVCYADYQVEIAHDFAKYAGRNICQRDRFPLTTLCEEDVFDFQSFDFGRCEDALCKGDGGHKTFGMDGAAHTLSIVCDPTRLAGQGKDPAG